MKRNNIPLFISLVAAALLVLLATQVYWVYTSYQLRRAQFDEKVMHVLSQSAADMEQDNTCLEVFSKINFRPHDRIFIARQHVGKEAASTVDSIPLMYLYDTTVYHDRSFYFTHPGTVQILMRYRLSLADTTPAALAKYVDIDTSHINVHNYRDIVSGDFSQERSVNMRFLDSMLRMHLHQEHISGSYHYGIINPQGNIEYASPGSTQNRIMQASLSTPVFDNKYFNKPYRLSIYFENPLAVVAGTLWGVLLASMLIIGILSYSFRYFIRTISRQKKLSEMKTDFINNMTHEFKTPITNIALAVETMHENGHLNGHSPFLRIISQENNRMRENVERILQIAAMDKEDIGLACENFDLHSLVMDIGEHVQLNSGGRCIHIHYHLEADNHILYADRTHIVNVLYNLLDNAVKYSQGSPDITISTYNMRNSIYLSIQDQGIGMGESTQKRIFDKFYRAHTGNRHDVKGFGLGLSYVKNIIERHGGHIGVESELQKGSTFTLELPCAPAEHPEAKMSYDNRY